MMPVFVVTQVREYKERWLIESESLDKAKSLEGLVLDHDNGDGTHYAKSILTERVYDETDELPSSAKTGKAA